jgi:hypothetical protein
MSARDAAIKRFNEDPDCKIFLMSLKAGGVALNLTVASHVSNSFVVLLNLICNFLQASLHAFLLVFLKLSFFFFFLKIMLYISKSVKGRNLSTREVYKKMLKAKEKRVQESQKS